MPYTHSHGRYAAIGGIMLTLGFAARSAPILPERMERPGQVHSLAGLHRIRIDVRPLSKDLRAVGLDAQTIHDAWVKAAEEQGLEVNDESPSLLELRIVTMEDPDDPGSFAINPVLMLYQDVNVRRIDGELSVPTYVSIRVGIEKRRDMAESMRDVLRLMRNRFLEDLRAANES